jgi:hypothetical protein
MSAFSIGATNRQSLITHHSPWLFPHYPAPLAKINQQ